MLAALTIAANAIALPLPPAPSVAASATPATQSADARKAQGRHAMDKSGKVEKNPDTAMIEFLGEYGGTADGLDPMGLADPDAASTKSAGDKECGPCVD